MYQGMIRRGRENDERTVPGSLTCHLLGDDILLALTTVICPSGIPQLVLQLEAHLTLTETCLRYGTVEAGDFLREGLNATAVVLRDPPGLGDGLLVAQTLSHNHVHGRTTTGAVELRWADLFGAVFLIENGIHLTHTIHAHLRVNDGAFHCGRWTGWCTAGLHIILRCLFTHPLVQLVGDGGDGLGGLSRGRIDFTLSFSCLRLWALTGGRARFLAARFHFLHITTTQFLLFLAHTGWVNV